MEMGGVQIIIRVIISVHQQASTSAKRMAGNQVIICAQEGLSVAGSEHLGCRCCTLRLYFPLSPAAPRAQRCNAVPCFHLSIYAAAHRKMHESLLHALLLLCDQQMRFRGLLQEWDTHAPVIV